MAYCKICGTSVAMTPQGWSHCSCELGMVSRTTIGRGPWWRTPTRSDGKATVYEGEQRSPNDSGPFTDRTKALIF